jgi:phosphotransferase system HPr (HPr) family protein
MVEKMTVVTNDAGIHCRPSTEILTTAQKFPKTKIFIEAKGERIELNSMLSLLSLGIACGDEVKIIVDGAEEEEICDLITELFAFNFDFPQNN